MRIVPVVLCLAAGSLLAQGSPTLEGLYHPTRKVSYTDAMGPSYAWMPDGRLLETRRGQVPRLLDPRTGVGEPLFDLGRLTTALAAAGAPEAKAKAALEGSSWTWNDRKDAFLLSLADDLYWASPGRGETRRLTATPGAEDEATFSPDGTRVAFLRGNDLYAVEVATGAETRLTSGGTEDLLNGRLDYVYQEEVYGRGTWKAFWWAPDSRRLAYLSLDVSKVPTYVFPDDRSVPQVIKKVRYSHAGDPIAQARLGVVDLAGKTQWVDHPYPAVETLTVGVGWDPQGSLLAAYQDRIQTWIELRRFQGGTGELLIQEKSPAWLEWQHRYAMPRFLKDGTFLWESERTGHHHVELHARDGKLIRPLTAGDWDVRKLHGVDEARGWLYVDTNQRSPIGQDVYRVGFKGSPEPTRLSETPGTHRATFDRSFSYYVDSWSDARTPTVTTLAQADGRPVRVLHDSVLPAFKDLKLGEVRLQQVKARDGYPMESLLVLPPVLEPGKKYPVFSSTYAGPGAATVRNAWGREMLWWQFLASKGIVVWICDNRSASGKGLASEYAAHRKLGQSELQDQLDGLEWLKSQGFADTGRVCLEGYSYGGFFTAYALTHSKAWKLGIVGAPVTDWRLYDSLYTERYMTLPRDNPEGYDAADLTRSAKDLSGKLLLVHGTQDDNVHPQHTVRFLDALQKAGHSPLLVLMPGSTHSPRAPQHTWARYAAMWEFMEKNL